MRFSPFMIFVGAVLCVALVPVAEAVSSRRAQRVASPQAFFVRGSVGFGFDGMVLLSETGDVGASGAGETGSQPLSPSIEMRLGRYIDHDFCPSTFDKVFNARCTYLLEQQRLQRRAQETIRGRLSPRTQNNLRSVSEGTVIRRSIGGAYLKQFKTTDSLQRARREQGGLISRPRTLHDAGEAFQNERDRLRALEQERRALRQEVQRTPAESE